MYKCTVIGVVFVVLVGVMWVKTGSEDANAQERLQPQEGTFSKLITDKLVIRNPNGTGTITLSFDPLSGCPIIRMQKKEGADEILIMMSDHGSMISLTEGKMSTRMGITDGVPSFRFDTRWGLGGYFGISEHPILNLNGTGGFSALTAGESKVNTGPMKLKYEHYPIGPDR